MSDDEQKGKAPAADSMEVHLDQLLDAVDESMTTDTAGAPTVEAAPPANAAPQLDDPDKPDESLVVHVDDLLESVKESVDSIEQEAARGAAIRAGEALLVLHHDDLQAARQFYGGTLGLEPRGGGNAHFASYWIGPKHELALCISNAAAEAARHAPRGSGPLIDLLLANVDETFARLVMADTEIVQPPTDRPWGSRTAIIRDPAGYALALSSPVKRWWSLVPTRCPRPRVRR